MKNLLRYTFCTLLMMVVSSFTTFAQVISYGTSENFVLFTTTGAFNNTGASVITGDLGTNAGAFTGFPPGIFSGVSHVGDPTSVTASIDVANAYAALSAMTCGPVLDVTLGNDQTLTPNIYCIGAATTLNGNLILDGQGNSNAVFIIKVNGALSTNSLSNVTLINSASLCNVIWQVNGAFSMGEGSVFRGNIVANGAITLASGTTLIGRCISNTGAININATTVRLPSAINITSSPVDKTVALSQSAAFTVTATGSDLTYQWRRGDVNLVNNANVSGVSTSELTFASVSAADTAHNYNVIISGDCAPVVSSNVALSLTMYTELASLSSEKEMTIRYSGSNHQISIMLNDNRLIGNSELRIYSLLGHEVMTIQLDKKETLLPINGFGWGIYFYKLIANNAIIQTGKLISTK